MGNWRRSLAGFPVWVIPWRGLQNAAAAAGPAGPPNANRSSVRSTFTSTFFFASVTVLGGAIYILSRLLSLTLGSGDSLGLVSDLADALGFGVIAAGVWIVHGLALRGDGAAARQEQSERLSSTTVAVVDGSDGHWGCAVLDALKREWPGVQLQADRADAGGRAHDARSARAGAECRRAGLAGVIVGPWSITAAAPPKLAQALASSQARKLMALAPAEGWGMDRRGRGERGRGSCSRRRVRSSARSSAASTSSLAHRSSPSPF